MAWFSQQRIIGVDAPSGQPARAPELALGALLVFLPARRDSAATSIITGIDGLALVTFSLAAINEGKAFPGFNAILTTLGTTLIILAGARPASVVNRALAVRPLVWLGLISYSLYLWHWPVIAFIRYTTGDLPTMFGLAALALMVVVTTLSYLFVELPCRS